MAVDIELLFDGTGSALTRKCKDSLVVESS
jgi:hypothetical protein